MTVAEPKHASWPEWDFPGDMKVTVVKKGGVVRDVLYNGRPLPPHAGGSLKIENEGHAWNVTLTLIALELDIEEAE